MADENETAQRVPAVAWLQAQAGLSIYGAQRWLRQSGIKTLVGGGRQHFAKVSDLEGILASKESRYTGKCV